MPAELTALALSSGWTCCSIPPALALDPAALDALHPTWIPMAVPGTAASAVRDAHGEIAARSLAYDELDWWFRVDLDVPAPGAWRLILEGVATVSDVWVDGEHRVGSTSMFRAVQVDLDLAAGRHRVDLRCAALSPLLAQRHPRPRWRSALAQPQSLRWWRTSLLGRMPGLAPTAAPVGPWLPVTLLRLDGPRVDTHALLASVEEGTGVLSASVQLAREVEGRSVATLRLGAVSVEVPVAGREPAVDVELRIPDVALWWPAGYGEQVLYGVELEFDGVQFPLGRIGFRTVELADPTDRLTLSVNGLPVFARGACWVPPDAVSLAAPRGVVRERLAVLASAGATMVRVTGAFVYESAEFWDACDELGLLVWEDVMLATLDPPDDDAFLADLAAEVADQLGRLGGRPSLVVVSGGSETEQQPTMLGLPADRRRIRAIEETIPEVVARVAPGVAYVTSSPSGGALPTHSGAGVAHWFGVGGYLRPLQETRSAGVRFAAECLAFSTPPEASQLSGWGLPLPAEAGPAAWKAGVPRDAGAAWDFEDVRDHYVGEVFDVDPAAVRGADPARYLDLGRAAVTVAMMSVFSEWRRPGSGCSGGLVLSVLDLVRGAGWGLLDVDGLAKAPLHGLAAVWAPRALLVTDEGLDGLALHVVNDAPAPLRGRLDVELVDSVGRVLERASCAVEVDAGAGRTVMLDAVLGVFRDVTHAYRFGPATYDCAHIVLSDLAGEEIADVVHLVSGQGRAVVAEVGLAASSPRGTGAIDGHTWEVDVSTRELAQWVVVDLPGYDADRSWFHLAPGRSRTVQLRRRPGHGAEPSGVIRALNSVATAVVGTSS